MISSEFTLEDLKLCAQEVKDVAKDFVTTELKYVSDDQYYQAKRIMMALHNNVSDSDLLEMYITY